ncbi:MAG: hypothetical protein IPO26_19710 [Saprospiraceae bacterium]|nr:hypothetical protein [Saprospiraceae bacterium]
MISGFEMLLSCIGKDFHAAGFWKYKNLSGTDYDINLYHGDISRHVIVYIGQEIIKIDFSVLGDKEYSFMLGEELFKLSIEYIKGKTNYTLVNVGKEQKILPFGASRTINKQRTIELIIGFVVFIIILLISYYLRIS